MVAPKIEKLTILHGLSVSTALMISITNAGILKRKPIPWVILFAISSFNEKSLIEKFIILFTPYPLIVMDFFHKNKQLPNTLQSDNFTWSKKFKKNENLKFC